MKSLRSALSLDLMPCPACGLVCRALQAAPGRRLCPRCGATLRRRKPESFTRSWALLISAVLLYVPANLLPIMRTSTLLELHNDTILSGVVVLWRGGSWDLAFIVFVASIVVPMLKISSLALLLFTAARGSGWRRQERTRLYRIIEFVGHWSMLDVFVVALLVTLVHFQQLASVQAGPAIVPFGAVVILTMLASMSFDPRLIWDEPGTRTAVSSAPDASSHG